MWSPLLTYIQTWWVSKAIESQNCKDFLCNKIPSEKKNIAATWWKEEECQRSKAIQLESWEELKTEALICEKSTAADGWKEDECQMSKAYVLERCKKDLKTDISMCKTTAPNGWKEMNDRWAKQLNWKLQRMYKMKFGWKEDDWQMSKSNWIGSCRECNAGWPDNCAIFLFTLKSVVGWIALVPFNLPHVTWMTLCNRL